MTDIIQRYQNSCIRAPPLNISCSHEYCLKVSQQSLAFNFNEWRFWSASLHPSVVMVLNWFSVFISSSLAKAEIILGQSSDVSGTVFVRGQLDETRPPPTRLQLQTQWTEKASSKTKRKRSGKDFHCHPRNNRQTRLFSFQFNMCVCDTQVVSSINMMEEEAKQQKRGKSSSRRAVDGVKEWFFFRFPFHWLFSKHVL